jgi:toxin HigB-1
MKVRFADPDLARLAVDAEYTGDGRYAPEAVRGFRRVYQAIDAAEDERDLRAMRSFRFEKLDGDRDGQYSMRLSKQWRLIITIEKGEPKNTIVVIEIVDYH